ncbi:MAG: type II toxin-antitoxin system Phd/YefM family antitoxin [Boseongicola sp. SB0662_bin_57]|nr:type II toxin-antitoxin system Phd/YefM family antitoxin [Boseongicola sp. SB0662_bin_57]
MPVRRLSSREFNQDVGRAKRAALQGPVIITNRGRPSHVLMSIERYDALRAKGRNLVDALSMPGLSDIDFRPPRASIQSREADLS